MLSSLPKRFFAACDPCSSTPSASAPPVCCDAYATLDTASGVLLWGIAPGTRCLIKLSSADKGFVASLGGGLGHAVIQTPDWPITEQGQTEDVTNDFDFLIGAVGSSTVLGWRQIPAPGEGNFRLETLNGRYTFVRADTIPGLTGVCSGLTKAEVGLFGCWLNSDDEWEIKKLNTPDGKVIVGYEDPDGNKLVRALPDASFLEHPKAKFPYLQVASFVQTNPTDPDGLPWADGLPTTDDESASIADLDLVLYSPGAKKFFRAPEPVAESTSTTSIPGVTVALTGGYVNVAGHMQIADVDFKWPKAFVSFNVQTDTAERVTFGLFIGGNLIHEWTYTNASGSAYSSPTLHMGSWLAQGIPLGVHKVEIKVKGTTGSSKFEYSDLNIFTVR